MEAQRCDEDIFLVFILRVNQKSVPVHTFKATVKL